MFYGGLHGEFPIEKKIGCLDVLIVQFPFGTEPEIQIPSGPYHLFPDGVIFNICIEIVIVSG
jgi:hypothetical protein